MKTCPAPPTGRPQARSRLAPWAWLALLCLLLATPVRAAAPDHRWSTMETPHFQIHFHEGLYEVALRAAHSLERSHERLVPLLGDAPRRRTQVVISDDSDAANGSATAAGRPWISLLAEPPDNLSVLGDFDDYLYLLAAHEYVHVVHLGTVRGLPSWLNHLFGDVWVPNGAQPRFVTEGYATYHESHLSSAGRMRSALFDMYLRADVLEDRVLDLGQLSNGPARWPWGTAWYLYGGKLVEYLAATRGDEALLRYSEEYGSSFMPWAMNVDLEQAAGIDWIALYDEWVGTLRVRYAAQRAAIEARGPVTAPAVRTTSGERTMGPRWAPDGRRIYHVAATSERRPWLRTLDVTTGAVLPVRSLGSSGEIAPLPTGGVLLARSEVHRAYRSFGELFEVTEGGEKQLTSGLRASEADVEPDGHGVVFVQRGEGRTRLARFDRRTGETQLLYEPPADQHVYTPRVSPDGRRIVFGETRAGHGRDLWVLDRRAGTRERLTDDGAVDLDPTFTPDGAAVIFSSDRTGVFDLYRIDLATKATERLTNVITGAFQPDVSPDGSWIAWTTYSSHGFDVAAAPLAQLTPTPAPAYVERRPESPAPRGGPLYPVRPYNPWETMAPQTWFPYLVADRDGSVLGATVAGGDVVGRHAWSLTAGAGLASRQPQIGIGYGYGGFFPRLEIGASSSWRSVPGFAAGNSERATGGGLSLTFPWSSTRRAHSLRIGYEATWLQPVERVGAATPDEGLAAELQVGFGFSSTERPGGAISAEDGVSFHVGTRFGDRSLGSDFAYAALDVSGGAYLRLPWAAHHVLAVLGRVGVGDGDLGRRRLYGLGGPTLRDPLLDLLYTGSFMGTAVLRGYAPGSFVGSRLVLGTVEYRFPIWNADAGAWTLPVYAGRLSGALFAEAGDAFDGAGTRRLHPAAGAELRWDVQLGILAGVVRLGNAWGFDQAQGGGNHVYLGIGAGF